ncbi:MAG: NPCBM/NEW2 domain-containing protein [Planctomycetales bacterium]
MSKPIRNFVIASLAILVAASTASAEEVRLFDNTRVYGLVRGVTEAGEVVVQQPTGEEQKLALENVITIRFLGRNPLLVQTGTQEFRFLEGSRLRGQILYNDADVVRVQTALAGVVDVDLGHLKGFVAMPLEGFSGRKAEELVERPLDGHSPSLDVVLDRRGSTYPGVVRRLDQVQLDLDHEDLLQVVPVRVLYVAGVRLADAARTPPAPWKGDVRVRIRSRDGSLVHGTLRKIHLGRWHVSPSWNPAALLELDVEEIALVELMGGRVQYLSQLEPVRVEESTVLAPPQPYRMDQSSQGDALMIAGKRYPRGIGVHADSELTFDLGGRFQEFHSDIGISSRMEDRGSVVFSLLGDGKELYKSPLVTGKEPAPIEVRVPVKGVKELTLEVTNGGDLDLSDVANWGSARVVR